MPSVRANHEVGAHFQFAARSFCAHADDATVLDEQIDHLTFHPQLERWKLLGMAGQEIEKIPLRHERDEFATCGKLREISDWHDLPIDHSAQFSHFLMRLFQKFVE